MTGMDWLYTNLARPPTAHEVIILAIDWIDSLITTRS